MKYNVYTGVEKARSKLKSYTFGTAAAIMLAAGFSVSSYAAGYTSNFPGNNGTSCDAWHGAPGGFGPNSPYYTVSGPQGGIGGHTFGQDQGVITGQNNSGYSAYCNQ